MKLTRIISLMLVLVMLCATLASCNLEEILKFLQKTTPEESTTTTTQPDNSTTTTPPQESTTSSTDKVEEPDPEEETWEQLYYIISIEKAIEIAMAETSIEPTTRHYIRGTIVKVSNPAYGEMVISDGVNQIYVYGVTGYSTMTDKPVKGDEVLLHCTLNTFNDTPQVKNAILIDFKKADKEDINASDYTPMSILEARETTLGTKISVTGVVARITYANGMKPSGVYLIDGTDSIYVYDADIAGQVEIGNKITVLGEKDYWVLDTEANNANKHGYKGCCQISSALLYENDNATNEIDFSWCEELTVKEILNIPVTENVTTTVFKTNALVKKVPGNGFTNYYFYDLDGKTGAYTYTQCNGNDFAWLDAFDGKICTVYLSPMNAKSTSSDCYFRFLPVAVIDEGFTFDLANAPKHVVEYYGIGQFLGEYTGNPLTELITSVSSTLLGFDNVELSYKSDNENIVYFTTEVSGVVVLHCKGNGTANVTITATHNGNTYFETITIKVYASEEIDADQVIDAIEAENNTSVTVVGIVGPSLVNQTGFYLIDETGAIPVRVNADTFEGLQIGQKIVVTGTRSVTKDGGGQICIDSAEIIANYYGKVDYSTESFIKDMTIEEIKAITDSPEATTNVFVVTALVQKTSKQQGSYTNVTYNVGGILLYTSSAKQYSWIENFFEEGQTEATLTIELALCDWNAKGLKGCILSVITDNGKVYNELNFTTGK